MSKQAVDRLGCSLDYAVGIAGAASVSVCQSRRQTDQAKENLSRIKAEANRLLRLPVYPWRP